MNGITSILQRARDAFDNLTERERRLIGILAVVVIGMLLFFTIRGQMQKNHALRTGAQARRAAISKLIANRARFAEAAKQRKIMQVKLQGRPPSVPTFVVAQTQKMGIPNATDFRDSHQPVGGRPDIQALSTEISFPQMSLMQLSTFARAVHASPSLLYIQRLRLRSKKDSTTFSVDMRLTTYHQDDDEDAK